MAPSAKAMTQVRAKPVMRETITQTLMSAADDPTDVAVVFSGSARSTRESVRSGPACLLMMGSSEVDPGNAGAFLGHDIHEPFLSKAKQTVTHGRAAYAEVSFNRMYIER